MAATGLLVPVAATAVDHGQTWRLTYTIHLYGLPLLDATAWLHQQTGCYALRAEAAAPGPLRSILPWRAEAEATGVFASGQVLARTYRALNVWRGRERGTWLDFLTNGTVRVTYLPPSSAGDHEPIPAALLDGVSDPLGGVFRVLAGLAVGDRCDRIVPVYDGRRRFDLIFRSRPPHPEPRHWWQDSAPPVPVCELGFRTLAGNRRSGERSRFWQTSGDGGDRPPLRLYMTPLPGGGPPVPSVMTTQSVMGPVSIYLSTAVLVSADQGPSCSSTAGKASSDPMTASAPKSTAGTLE